MLPATIYENAFNWWRVGQLVVTLRKERFNTEMGGPCISSIPVMTVILVLRAMQ
jgi:hypothetical protein